MPDRGNGGPREWGAGTPLQGYYLEPGTLPFTSALAMQRSPHFISYAHRRHTPLVMPNHLLMISFIVQLKLRKLPIISITSYCSFMLVTI